MKVHKGVDTNGQELTGMECDTVDEIEALIDRFDSEDMLSRKQSMKEAMAEKSFEDMYKVGEDHSAKAFKIHFDSTFG